MYQLKTPNYHDISLFQDNQRHINVSMSIPQEAIKPKGPTMEDEGTLRLKYIQLHVKSRKI